MARGGAFPLTPAGETAFPMIRRPSRERLLMRRIKREVASFYCIPLMEMTSARRAREVARPRQVAMYLSKRLTKSSLPEIGRRFGNRDHTTVIHAVRTVEELCAEDAEFAEDIEDLTAALKQPEGESIWHAKTTIR